MESNLEDKVSTMEGSVCGMEDELSSMDEKGEELFSAVHANHLLQVERLLCSGAAINVSDKAGNTVLHTAAKLGYFELCFFLIKRGADINAQNKAGMTPLFLASSMDVSTVQILIQLGCDVELCNLLGEIPLHAASSAGLVDVIVELISSGNDVNARSSQGFTPLYLAIGSGSRNAVKALMRFGADANEVLGPTGFSGREEGCQDCYEPAKSDISKHVAVRVCVPRQEGEHEQQCRQTSNQFQFLGFGGMVSKEFRPIQNHPTAPNQRKRHECRHPADPSTFKRYPDQGRLREQHQLNQQLSSSSPCTNHCQLEDTIKSEAYDFLVKSRSKCSHDPQHPCVQDKRQQAHERLQCRERKPPCSNWEPSFSTCPASLCRKNRELLDREHTRFSSLASDAVDFDASEQYHICQKLDHKHKQSKLQLSPLSVLSTATRGKTADQMKHISQPATKGITPLHRASQLGMESVAKVLLESGANVNAKTQQSETPLHFAAKYSSTLGHGEVTGLLRLLLASGADIEAVTSSGETALHLAALVGDSLSASILISLGADVSKRDLRENVPLHKVCEKFLSPEANRVRTVRLLLTNGAEANAINCDGHTPLHVLLLQKDDSIDLDVVRLLLEHSADVNQRTPAGQHPLLLTLENRMFDFARVLLEKGANPNVSAEDGKTPMHYACKAGHTQLFKMIWSKGGDPTMVDTAGFSPLRNAVESGVEAMVRVCLNSGGSTCLPIPASDRYRFYPGQPIFLNDAGDFSSKLYSPFQYAFATSQHAIVEMLFASGCFTLGELHELQSVCEVVNRDELSKSQRKVVQFVLDVCLSPPSLQNFCRWKISHLIGCCADRKARARSLGLPSVLRDYILFVNGA